jgi:hypothetical protein
VRTSRRPGQCKPVGDDQCSKVAWGIERLCKGSFLAFAVVLVLSGWGKNSSKFRINFVKFMMERGKFISAETSSQILIKQWHYSFNKAKSSNPPKPGTSVLVSFCAVRYVSSQRKSSLVCKNKFNIDFESDQSFLLQNFIIYWISIRCDFFWKMKHSTLLSR